ncbi:hypothetical protein ACIBU0_38620 [Streptomyces sp. NPDC049627]|uniref:hypothetical protein n=1 Tax=Streptomyces sp. NPDC049627 TaxID=3365595 RepID=UPI00378FB882
MSGRTKSPTRWRRRAALIAVAAVLLAGAVWRLKAIRDAMPQVTTGNARSSVLGTWKVEDPYGGQVELAANGRFSAVGLPLDTAPSARLTGAGKWSLDDRGTSVILTPDHAPSDMNPDTSMPVVRADGRVKLCVYSSSPGVLCDLLLGRTAAPQ